MIVFRKDIAMPATLVAAVGNVPLKSKVLHGISLSKKPRDVEKLFLTAELAEACAENAELIHCR